MRKSTASLLMAAITLVTAAALWAWPVERWETVKTARVFLGSVEKTVAVVGTVARKGEYFSAHLTGGVVAQVYVQEGQYVTAGQPLYRLEDSRHQAALKQAMQGLESAQDTRAALSRQAAQAFGEQAQGLADQGLSSFQLAQDQWAAQVDGITEEIAALTQRAYRDGQVLSVLAREGELLLPGSPGAVLASLETEIRAVVGAGDARRIAEGMGARISQNGVVLCRAQVAQVGLLKPDGQGIPRAQVTFALEEGLSVPVGAQVVVDVILQERSQVPVVPVEAITQDGTVFLVYGGRAWERGAAVALWDDDFAQVEQLPLGAEVVLGPKEDLRDGVRLKVVKP